MKIAILGTRGVPARYGGFETLAEELSVRLAERGHEVTVYCRSHYTTSEERMYKGVKLETLPAIKTKHLDTVSHTFLSVLHNLIHKTDVVFICNAANALFAAISRLAGRKVVINVDGLERLRKKWGWAGRTWYELGERFSTLFPHVVVTDAKTIQAYYFERYGRQSTFIAYGTNIKTVPAGHMLRTLGLERRQYVLYVSRLERENNAHLVIREFERYDGDLRLVVVGGAPYADAYIRDLRSTRDPRIMFPGFVYGEGYQELQSNAFAYVHATEVGGSHPALIEALGFGNCVIYHPTAENKEVAGEYGIPCRLDHEGQFARDLIQLQEDADLLERYRNRARERARDKFDWEKITDDYERLFETVMERRK